jgi:GGDEF domain-containing protein
LSPVLADGKPREHDLFLRHRQGHRIPVHVRSRAIFDAAGAIIGAMEVFESRTVTARTARRALVNTGCLDPVAEVNNRAYGEFRLRHALEALRTFGISFGWLAVKLHGIERLEPRYGNRLVDAAMKMTARTLDWNLGPQDSATRWDRTEFRIEVHSCWGVELSALIGKLAALVRTLKLDWWGDPVRITASIAGATAEAGDSVESIEARAAEILLKSRTAGSDPEKDFLRLGDESCLE